MTDYRLRVELPSGQVVLVDPPTVCSVGGVNWPLCALGVEVHVACLPEDVQRYFPNRDGWLRRRRVMDTEQGAPA